MLVSGHFVKEVQMHVQGIFTAGSFSSCKKKRKKEEKNWAIENAEGWFSQCENKKYLQK